MACVASCSGRKREGLLCVACRLCFWCVHLRAPPLLLMQGTHCDANRHAQTSIDFRLLSFFTPSLFLSLVRLLLLGFYFYHCRVPSLCTVTLIWATDFFLDHG